MARLAVVLATSVLLLLAGCQQAETGRATKAPAAKKKKKKKTSPPPPLVRRIPNAKRRPGRPHVPRNAIPAKGRPRPHEVHGAPHFVKRGSGVFDQGGGRWFLAVGKTKGTKDRKVAHAMADKSADAEMAKLLDAYNAKAILVAGKEGGSLSDLTKKWVKKSAIVDHWIDHSEDEWHSLKRLDATAYQAAVAAALSFDEAQKKKLGAP